PDAAVGRHEAVRMDRAPAQPPGQALVRAPPHPRRQGPAGRCRRRARTARKAPAGAAGPGRDPLLPGARPDPPRTAAPRTPVPPSPPPSARPFVMLHNNDRPEVFRAGTPQVRGDTMADYQGRWSCVEVEVEDGIAWVTLNRPAKRNAMSPTLNREMLEVLDAI